MNTEVLLRVRERGYWRVLIRPTAYAGELVPSLKELEDGVRSSVVQIRGWDYPHWPRTGPARLRDSIDSSTDWQDHKEYWRAYRSGQFVHYFALREDWVVENTGIRRIDIAPRTVLSYDSTIFSFIEIFLFAGRWARQWGLGPKLRVELAMIELAGRNLYSFDPNKVPFEGRQTAVGRFDHNADYEPEAVIGDAVSTAAPALRKLLELFHWDVTEEYLRDYAARELKRL
jgi:hypothetical protein